MNQNNLKLKNGESVTITNYNTLSLKPIIVSMLLVLWVSLMIGVWKYILFT